MWELANILLRKAPIQLSLWSNSDYSLWHLLILSKKNQYQCCFSQYLNLSTLLFRWGNIRTGIAATVETLHFKTFDNKTVGLITLVHILLLYLLFFFMYFIYSCILSQFLDQDRIVTASSTGAVTIFRLHQNSQVHTGSVMSVTYKFHIQWVYRHSKTDDEIKMLSLKKS